MLHVKNLLFYPLNSSWKKLCKESRHLGITFNSRSFLDSMPKGSISVKHNLVQFESPEKRNAQFNINRIFQKKRK